MKNLKQFMLFLMIGSLVTLSGCSSSDDGGNGGNAAEGTITAKVDGASFTSLEIASTATLVSATSTLILQGSDADGKGFLITINGYAGPGTYNIDGNAIGFSVAVYLEADVSNPANMQTWQAPYNTSVNGTISVSEETSDNVKGTFEFTGQNASDNSQKVISEGSFNLGKQTV